MSLIGIYRIVNNVNGKCYVGSAVNLNNRWRIHKHNLKNKKHKNNHLQNAWNKYGEENFIFEILEYVYDKKDLIKIEQYYIDWLDSTNREFGYNICKVAGNVLGYKHTDKTKQKLSDIGKTKFGINNSFYGEHHTKETKEKLRIINLNRSVSSETKQKISNALTGRKLSERREWRKKIGLANSGDNTLSAKLNWEKVEEIRNKHIPGVYGYKKLAEEYGVSVSCVENVVNFKTWKRSN